MTLLLFNYAMFQNPALLIVGWVIAGIEAFTAILHLCKILFKNNKKVVEKIDKTIEKMQTKLVKLQHLQAELQVAYAYEQAKKDNAAPVDVILPAPDGAAEPDDVEEPDDAKIDEMNKEAAAEFDEREKADFDTTDYKADAAEIIPDHIEEPTAESYELFKKFIGSLQK